MRRALAALPALLLAGCGGENHVAKTAGYWPGLFYIESAAGDTSPARLQSEALKGYLQLYAGKMRFKMEMKSANQRFTVDGTWSVDGDRVRIVGEDFTFDQPPEEDQKARGLTLVEPGAIRKTLKNGLSFRRSADNRNLAGQKTSLGHLLGEFRFDRPIPR